MLEESVEGRRFDYVNDEVENPQQRLSISTFRDQLHTLPYCGGMLAKCSPKSTEEAGYSIPGLLVIVIHGVGCDQKNVVPGKRGIDLSRDNGLRVNLTRKAAKLFLRYSEIFGVNCITVKVSLENNSKNQHLLRF